MKYENPEIPEGINVSEENQFKELAILGGGIALIALIGLFVLGMMAEVLVGYIPFEYEKELVSSLPIDVPLSANAEVIEYLEDLTAELAEAQNLPPGMEITVHYVEDKTVNAFATLGGHIVVFRGLIEKLPSENALAMVISHEIAHIKHRHPIMAMGRGVVITLAVAAISGVSGSSLTDNILGSAGLLTVLSFSREQESEADVTGLKALNEVYGHVSGAAGLFEMFAGIEKKKTSGTPQFLLTHPHSEDRVERIHEMARANGWSMAEQLEPIPEILGAAPGG